MEITEETIRLGAQKEVVWGMEQYGEKLWSEHLWGRIVDSKVTLFHGTSSCLLGDILAYGLRPSVIGHSYTWEEWKEMPEGERPIPAVWLAYTPYLAFFFGDTLVQVTIPISWITEANDGVYVEQPIPPTMIDRFLHIEDWR